MLFYIGLFIACVVVSLGFLFLYRSLAELGRIIYHAFLPTGRDNRTPPAEEHARNVTSTANETPAPWGWYGRTAARKAARKRPATPGPRTPWGWPGSKRAVREHVGVHGIADGFLNRLDKVSKPERIVSPDVGWPYREEKFEFAGKDYKVLRKAAPKPTDLKKTGKPWGW